MPQTAYLDNGVKSKGLIVDLLEIRSLSLLDAKKIANPFSSGILYSDLPPFPDREELIQMEHSDKTLNRLSICEMGSFIIPLIKYPQPLLQLEEMGILFFTEVFHLT